MTHTHSGDTAVSHTGSATAGHAGRQALPPVTLAEREAQVGGRVPTWQRYRGGTERDGERQREREKERDRDQVTRQQRPDGQGRG
jgi:hypothetical protein